MEVPFQITEVPADAIVKFPTIQVGPSKYILPANGKKFLKDIHDFQPRSTDVIVMGFSRSGTSVTQEMVWMLCNNFDFNRIDGLTMTERFPCLEHRMVYAESALALGDHGRHEYIARIWDEFLENQGDRFMKTHLPFGLLSPKFLDSGAKVVYVIRDPREVIVSNYKLCLLLGPSNFFEDFEKFWIAFKDNRFIWTPFFEAIVDAWKQRKADNLLLLSYRGFVKEQNQTIKLVAKFLEKDMTEEQCFNLQMHLGHKYSKEQDLHMVVDEATKKVFTRNDNVWKDLFARSLETEVNAWVEENLRSYELPQNLFEVDEFSAE